MFPVRVISLARQPERRAEFALRNAHVPHSFFDGIDGRALTDRQIRDTGLFLPEVEADYDRRAYGTTLSHWNLWKEAAAASGPLTIAEDDAVFRDDFAETAPGVVASLPEGWDVILWGWNFDSILHVQPMGTVTPIVMVTDQAQLRKSIDEFKALRTPAQPLRMVKAFGLLAYTFSPKGARRFLDLCFPQRALAVHLPLFNTYVRNVNVDVSTNAHYGGTNSFICFPPLAVSPNVR
jgi:GR25 family glycosyltransferase involved in LPS biosynthesis